VLAVDRERNEIVLARSFPAATLRYQDFVKALEQFVLYANTWMDRLDRAAHGEGADTGGPATPFSSLLRI
jgi:hypothetical protein